MRKRVEVNGDLSPGRADKEKGSEKDLLIYVS